MLYILSMYALLACSFTITKRLLPIFDPLILTIIRIGLCALLTGSYYLLVHKKRIRINSAYILMISVLGLLNVYAANALQIAGLQYMNSVHATLWYNCTPFIIGILDWLIYQKALSRLKIIALIIGWLSFVPLVLEQQALISGNNYIVGVIYFLSASGAMALSGLLIEHNSQIRHYPLTLTNALSLTVGTLCALVHFVFFYTCSIPLCANQVTENSLVLLIASSITAACAALYSYFVQQHTALTVTFAGFTLPLFSLLIEFAQTGAISFTMHNAVSITLLAIALYLFTYEPGR